jgi:hypothetical protein
MANYRLQRLDGTIDGPLTSAELKDLASRGQISPADRVAPEGSDRWVPAMRVNGIREILEARAIADDSPGAAEFESTIPLQSPIRESPYDATRPESRSPSATSASHASPPQYGVLRCVAGWIIAYGWLVIAIGFAFSFFVTVLLARDAMGSETTWSGGFIAIIVLLCLAAGIAVAFAAHSFAHRGDRLTAAFATVVLLPVVPFMINGIREGTISTSEGLVFLQVILGSLSILILGSVLVAVGEFLVAHADIATNSWYGRPDSGR